MFILFEVGLIGGLLAVASNPSPFYAALGLVGAAGFGCFLMWEEGASFLSLVLFLVYLGGMMVVFAYSAALVAEPFPKAWGSPGVLGYLVVYVGLLWVWWNLGGTSFNMVEWAEVGVFEGDWFGAAAMYSAGGGFLLVVGWTLLLTLFGALEVVRGHYCGVLRAV